MRCNVVFTIMEHVDAPFDEASTDLLGPSGIKEDFISGFGGLE